MNNETPSIKFKLRFLQILIRAVKGFLFEQHALDTPPFFAYTPYTLLKKGVFVTRRVRSISDRYVGLFAYVASRGGEFRFLK